MSTLESCLTCFRKTDSYLRITDETNVDDVERIITTHFWFSESECSFGILCTSCWEKIDDFHKFYCEVRKVHVDNRTGDEPVELQIKVETLDVSIKRETDLDVKDENNDVGSLKTIGKEPESEEKLQDEEEQKEAVEVPVQKKRGRKRKVPDIQVEVKQRAKRLSAVKVAVDPEESDQSDNESDWEPSKDDISGEEFTVKQKRSREEKKPRKKYASRKPRKEDEDPSSYGKTKEDIAREDEFIRRYCAIYCDKCSFNSDTFGELKAHTTAVHNCNPMVVCCDHKFYKRSFLYQHAQYHENPDKFKCPTCSKVFHSGFALKLHVDYTHVKDEERIYKCNVCEASFAKAYHLTSHRLQHTSIEEKRFYCVECDIAFRTNQSYRTHLHSKHGAAAKFVCDICARGFRQRSDLLTHQLTHSAEGLEKLKTQCERCGKWMKNRKSIWPHRKICQSTGPVACDICGKMVANPGQLKNHKKFMHHDQRVHQCSYCEKAFKRALDLKEHETIHTGEVLYSCQFCAKTFNSNSNLYSHRRKMHPIEYADLKLALQMKKQPMEVSTVPVSTRVPGAIEAPAMPAELPSFLPSGLMPVGVLPSGEAGESYSRCPN